jgi:hypothetical protein
MIRNSWEENYVFDVVMIHIHNITMVRLRDDISIFKNIGINKNLTESALLWLFTV